MKRVHRIAALAIASSLFGCAAMQSYPLRASGAGAQALFAPIEACAAERQLQAIKHPDSVNVKAIPGAWVQFMNQPTGFRMVVLVDDSTGGPEAIQKRSIDAKQKGDEIYACAEKAAANAPPAASVEATAAASTPGDGSDTAAAPPPSDGGDTAASPKSGGPAGPNLGGLAKGLDGAMAAIGKGTGVMAKCTQLTMCRTRLSGELCMGVDHACLSAINGGKDHGPNGCDKTLEGVRAAAGKYMSRIPSYKLPDECK